MNEEEEKMKTSQEDTVLDKARDAMLSGRGVVQRVRTFLRRQKEFGLSYSSIVLDAIGRTFIAKPEDEHMNMPSNFYWQRYDRPVPTKDQIESSGAMERAAYVDAFRRELTKRTAKASVWVALGVSAVLVISIQLLWAFGSQVDAVKAQWSSYQQQRTQAETQQRLATLDPALAAECEEVRPAYESRVLNPLSKRYELSGDWALLFDNEDLALYEKYCLQLGEK